MLRELLGETPACRLTAVLRALGIASSSWYRPAIPAEQRRRPGPKPKAVAKEVVLAVVNMAVANPWYGYKRIAVMCRRAGSAVKGP